MEKTPEQKAHDRNRDRVKLQVVLDNMREVKLSARFHKTTTDDADSIAQWIEQSLDRIIKLAEEKVAKF